MALSASEVRGFGATFTSRGSGPGATRGVATKTPGGKANWAVLMEEAAGRIGETGGEEGRRGREAIEDAVGGAADKARDALGGLLGGEDDEK